MIKARRSFKKKKVAPQSRDLAKMESPWSALAAVTCCWDAVPDVSEAPCKFRWCDGLINGDFKIVLKIFKIIKSARCDDNLKVARKESSAQLRKSTSFWRFRETWTNKTNGWTNQTFIGPSFILRGAGRSKERSNGKMKERGNSPNKMLY